MTVVILIITLIGFAMLILGLTLRYDTIYTK